MQVSSPSFIFLTVGLVVGYFVAWLMLKSKLMLADANGRAAGKAGGVLNRTA